MAQKTDTRITAIQETIRQITGLEAKYVEDYDLLRIIEADRLQVRIDRNNAPVEMVDRYALQMEGGANFPPIVVTSDARLVDGNTRTKANRKRDTRHAPALVIAVSWEKAEDDIKKRLLLLGFVLNNRNGKALDLEERRRMVRDALALGWDKNRIQYEVGLPLREITQVEDELTAEKRLAEVTANGARIAPEEFRNAKALQALGKKSAQKLDDEAFLAVALLSRDAGFRADEIKSLATTVGRLQSAESKGERIARERETAAGRISDRQQGQQSRVPLSKQLRSHLMTLEQNAPELFVEHGLDDMAEHHRVIKMAIGVLQEILTRQEGLFAEDEASQKRAA